MLGISIALVAGLQTGLMLFAPTVFEKAGSRTLAGDIAGSFFHRLAVIDLAVSPLLVAGAVFCPPAAAPALARAGLFIIAGAAVAQSLYIVPTLERLREEFGSAAELPLSHPKKGEFSRLHGLSMGTIALTTLIAYVLLGLLLA